MHLVSTRNSLFARSGRALLFAFACGLLGFLTLPDRLLKTFEPTVRAASAFTVNSTGDGADGDTSDGLCNDGTGNCTLRAALMQSNATPGRDTITFAVGSGLQTILPTASLPLISDPVVIDATTQPGFAGKPIIELDCSRCNANPERTVFQITAGNSVVRGFVFSRFSEGGIKLQTGGGNLIEGNYFGTNTDGTSSASGRGAGITINGSSGNLIGGTTRAARNVIFRGISIFNGATHNVVQGNYIGTNADGTAAFVNSGGGVFIGSPDNTIGGTTPGAGNVISGNNDGITIQPPFNGPAGGNIIQGNFIGTNADGSAALGNSGTGIVIFDSSNNVIGGTTDGARNIISGNNFAGLRIAGHATSAGATTAAGNVVQGNYIGTDATGSTPLGNRVTGLSLTLTVNTLIGGTTPGAGNIIAGTRGGSAFIGDGIQLLDTINTKVQGNYIGTNADGSAALGNAQHGLAIVGVNTNVNTVVGGVEAGAGNVIAFNAVNGVFLSTPGAGHAIRRNSIFSNGQLGIDLAANGTTSNLLGIGITPNDAGDADKGSNNLQNFPIIRSVNTGGGSTTAQGTLNSAANATYTIELFANNACDPSAHGEGQLFLGATTANTDAGGNADFSATFPAELAPGQVITATATDPSGNTSEFSACNEVDQPGRVQFYPGAYTVNENVGSVSITVVRTLGTADTASIDYATSNGTATAGEDYIPANGTFSFASGETVKTFTLRIVNDSLGETPETINLTLSNPAGSALGSPHTAVLTIVDNDPLPSLRVTNPSVIEDTPDVETHAFFYVLLLQASNTTVTVDYMTADGTATANQDYVPVSGQLTFAPGETEKLVAVKIIADTSVEPGETFQFILKNARNASLPPFPATGLIRNNDSCSYSITPSSRTSPAAGETFGVNVSAPVGCTWAAQSNSHFIGIITGVQGNGNGIVTLSIVPNDSGVSRTGTVTIAGQTFTVTQSEPLPEVSIISFSQANYELNEGAGRAALNITRTGDISGVASADYRTTDTDTFTVGCADATNNQGGAYARCDFATSVGRLDFAAGESQKTLFVPIIDDGHDEPAETFQVVLSNLSGVTPGATTTTVTIQDNDEAGAQNPVTTSHHFFIRQQYLDFLSREPDTDGFNAWLGVLSQCADPNTAPHVPSQCDRIYVSGEGFFRSQEFQLKGFYVFRFYRAAFNRLPEYPEIVADMSFVAGQTAEEVFARKAQLATLISERQEFQTAYGAMSNEQYVSALLGRYNLTHITTPDPAQPDGAAKVTLTSAELASRLDGGTLTRAQVLRAVADSEAVGAHEVNNAFVGMQYYGYLRRKPDEAGFRAWLSVLQSGDVRTMVNGFLNSTEYRLRFGRQ